jgi:hypothetical protein
VASSHDCELFVTGKSLAGRGQTPVESSLMAAVGEVLDGTWQNITVGAPHRRVLELAFQPPEAAAKRINDAYFANLFQGVGFHINLTISC